MNQNTLKNQTDNLLKISKPYFEKERDLRDALFKLILNPLLDLKFDFVDDFEVSYSKREVPIGSVIPDLVHVLLNYDLEKSLLPPRWTYKHAFISWLLKEHISLTPIQISELMFTKPERIRPLLKDMIRYKALFVNKEGKLELSETINRIRGCVITFEAKLKNYKEALNQAIHYLRFSDYVIVAMEYAWVPVKNAVLKEYSNYGIGLCTLKDNNFEWVLYPQKNTGAVTADREYILTSAVSPSRHKLWSRRKRLNASRQASI